MFLSIIIPVYNSAYTIKQCLDSITNQGFSNYEIIIVNDGSTDDSDKIINEYINYHKDIKIVLKNIENSGPSIARNIGIDLATGDYIWFVDSDDEIIDQALEILYKTTNYSNSDIIRFSHRTITKEKEHRKPITFEENVYENESLFYIQYNVILKAWSASLNCWKHIYKRELIKDIRFVSEKDAYGEDILFNCLVYPKAKKIHIITDILYKYYLYGDSLSHRRQHILKKVIDSYKYIKGKYIEWNIWDKYKYALVSSYGDYFILGGGNRNYGALYSEYESYDDLMEAHMRIQEIIYSNDFQDLVKDGLSRELPDVLKHLYKLLEQRDPMEAYKMIKNENIQKDNVVNKDNTKVNFNIKLEILNINNKDVAVPISGNDRDFVIDLNNESSYALKYLMETEDIEKTIELLQLKYVDEKYDDIKEMLLDFIYELKSLKIIY